MSRNEHSRRVMGSQGFPSWATPEGLYRDLDAEFHFNFDPCPLGDQRIWDGRLESWAGRRVYCNPPYGREIPSWLAKAREAECAVYLLPARTDTKWWHDLALQADEIRFVRGRLIFGGPNASGNPAPFPSVILVYRGVVTCYECGHAPHDATGCFEPTPEEAPGACLCSYVGGAPGDPSS